MILKRKLMEEDNLRTNYSTLCCLEVHPSNQSVSFWMTVLIIQGRAGDKNLHKIGIKEIHSFEIRTNNGWKIM
jgi:hypothetical protein